MVLRTLVSLDIPFIEKTSIRLLSSGRARFGRSPKSSCLRGFLGWVRLKFFLAGIRMLQTLLHFRSEYCLNTLSIILKPPDPRKKKRSSCFPLNWLPKKKDPSHLILKSPYIYLDSIKMLTNCWLFKKNKNRLQTEKLFAHQDTKGPLHDRSTCGSLGGGAAGCMTRMVRANLRWFLGFFH